jgi:hypothetical protein
VYVRDHRAWTQPMEHRDKGMKQQLAVRLTELTGRPVKLKAPRRGGKRTGGAEGGSPLVAETPIRRFFCILSPSGRVTALSRPIQDWPQSSRSGVHLLVVPYMAAAGRSVCAAANVSWLDLSGNARIVAPGLLIQVEGRPNRFKPRGRPWSPFAAKSARLSRFLLRDPSLYRTQREIAAATGLSESFVSKIAGRLEDDAMLERHGDTRELRPRSPDLLLKAWEEDYDFYRHRVVRGHVPGTDGEDLLRRLSGALADARVKHAATGLAAGWLLSSHAVFRLATVYVEAIPEQDVLEALSFRETERGPNTWLVVPNDEGVFQGSAVRADVPCVHPVQAFLDLHYHPERSQEAATRIRETYMNWAGTRRP